MKRNYNRNDNFPLENSYDSRERKKKSSSDLYKSRKRFANVFTKPFASSSFTFYVTYARLFTVRFTLADFPRPLIFPCIRDTRSSIEKTATADRLLVHRRRRRRPSPRRFGTPRPDGSASNRLAKRAVRQRFPLLCLIWPD